MPVVVTTSWRLVTQEVMPSVRLVTQGLLLPRRLVTPELQPEWW